MNVLVIVMDLTGVVLIFLAMPLVLFPLFEEALSTTPPLEAREELADHVVICSFSPRTEVPIDELEAREIEYVIVESDLDRATELHETGRPVVHRDADAIEGLEAARLSNARTLVADVDDQTNTSIVLTAKEIGGSVQVISVVEDPDREHYHRLAGADTVLTPRLLLGESLAAKVTTSISRESGDVVEITEDFELAELPVHRDSDLVGRTIVESEIRERTGCTVVGVERDGSPITDLGPEFRIEANDVLIVAGTDEGTNRFTELVE